MAKKRSKKSSNAPKSASGVPREQETRGNGGELHQLAGGSHPPLTTNQGLAISDDQNSLRIDARGPSLLEDFILREKITHFDHERIPERIVHARGTGVHGTFTLSKSLARHTRAKVLTDVGVATPVFARFSTVAGGAGSVDTPRDVRGFSVKFYTSEGNWDLVGNNIPVFFIQDALKFPDLVHALKMEPDRGFPQAASAHDTLWDFITLTPESMHAIMWAMSDRTLPRSLRMIEGFGVHSFRLLDERGRSTFVKFHWRPTLGLQSTLWDEAVKLAGADNDFHRRDMFNAIEAGNFPAWDLAVQLFTEADAAKFPFDHLDPTKLIPEELVPLTIVGRMVLDRWPDNFFAETEQAAFCPSNLVPGIDVSDDPLLQGRLFSYLDTQLLRLGGPNFHQIPINAPQVPSANLQRDGHMQMLRPKGRVNYEPSSLDGNSPREVPRGFSSFQSEHSGLKARVRSETFRDHYSQARQFYVSQVELEQAHMAAALVFELSKVQTVAIRERMVGHLRHIDGALARRVADGLGLATLPPAPKAAAPTLDLPPSPALQIIGKMRETLEGRAVGVLIDDGTDAKLLRGMQRAVEAAGATVTIVAPKVGGALLSDGKKVAADGQLAGTPSVFFDAVVVLLSSAAGAKLGKEAAAVDWVRDAYGHLKAIAHDAGGGKLLVAAGLEPDRAVIDATRRDEFVALACGREWSREHKVRMLP